MYATFWALVPPIIAIALALITKEVYSSLFIGMLAGALFYANFNFEATIKTLFVGATGSDGAATGGMIAKLSDSWNVGILIFLVVLGVMVALMNRAGGSAAYGKWAASKIKSKRGAQLATFGLGALIFIDDYFNCLTVGSVMRPVTDKFKISRAKLAYIIDATAAPVCIIAPISSWAAAVTGVVEGEDGLSLFIRSVPFNFYALLTIVMIIVISVIKLDFGSMKKHEDNAENGDLYTTPDRPYENAEETYISARGKIIDLVLPVILLIACCITGMIYTGGFFSGESFIDAFANCDASLGLVYGSVAALILTFILYISRRVLSFKEFMESIPKGFTAMVPAILILTFAWTLGGLTNLLGADVYVAGLIELATESGAAWVTQLLPAIVFAIALGLAFATGTSWGTFGILLPIIVPVLPADSTLLVISISACLAGAVCGDHISPISDTTIMASAGAQSNHINHVSTQIPYALLVAGVSFVCYLLA
ncbi:MAG: Na+/H+ antiporter NhaC family protein, partial [Clostridia bacterium]|nr:Na+/H+ antiporter NhaC family protein [Clostridia bacterium]